MSVNLASLTAALLQLPAVFETQPGQLFLGIVALLAVMLVGRIVLKIAWKVTLVAGLGLGAFLLVTTFLV
ncbi:hypothetical protein [Halorarum salinum]|uniref:Uncharacterized protein n=1 Tax=Halorarum salinum TaxID=2743089 RepID=A0A7D5LA29_9EURY|nr:hypothetical protein [Halobaculum salinum]QLG61510.1 hypothetical protein HUG12_07125 [Halobaculum salinum]